MAEEGESLVRELLKRLHSRFDKLEAGVLDLRIRMSAMEGHMAQMVTQMAAMNARMDRFEERMTRVERRLELRDA